MMAEVIEVQLEGVALWENDFAEFLDIDRFPVGGQAHHLVLIAIGVETEVKCDGIVQEPDRVRVKNFGEFPIRCALALSQDGADEVAHAIDRKDGGAFKWRKAKAMSQVGVMMLDIVESRADPIRTDITSLRQSPAQAQGFALTLPTVDDRRQRRPPGQSEQGFATEIRTGIEADR